MTIRRVFLSPQKLAEELARPRQGALVPLPRDDFEALVRRATTPSGPPRLIEAAYEAVLVDGDLVGSARWQVVQSADGLLPLGPFNLALTQLPQRRPVPTALAVALVGLGPSAPPPGLLALPTEVPVGDFDGKGPALLLDGPARHTLDLAWKAHGEARPDGWHFDLRWPAASAAFIDLILPGDTGVTVPESVLLAGPLPLLPGDRRNGPPPSPNDRRWRLYCGKLDQLDLVLQPARPGPNPLPLVRTVTTQTICPDAVEARYELDVEVLHQSLKQLVFECDPGLEPYDVNGRHIEGWEVMRGTPQRLVVRLREPLRGDRFTIDCLAPVRSAGSVSSVADLPASQKGVADLPASQKGVADLPASQKGVADLPAATGPTTWTSPGLRLAGAINRGETLLLRLHPDLHLEHWQPGDFRLENAETVKDPERGDLYQLTLHGGGLLADPSPGQAVNPAAPPRRPSAMVQAAGTTFRVRQLAWWQIGPGRQKLTLSLAYEVLQGQLTQQVVRLPPGWDVEGVKVEGGKFDPPKLLSRTIRTSPQGRDLVVDLQSPLRPLVPGTLIVDLLPTAGAAPLNQELPFPDAVPLGARYREGVLAVDIEQALAVSVHSSVPEGAAADSSVADLPASPKGVADLPASPKGVADLPAATGPWGNHTPDYCYPYRGEAPRGGLTLRPRTPELRVRCTSDVVLHGQQASVESRLQIEAEAGSPKTLDVFLSTANPGAWEWGPAAALAGPPRRLVDVELVGRLTPLLASSPLSAAALHVARPPGQLWRLKLARPLHGHETLVLVGSVHVPRPSGSWEVPLPTVPGATRLGEVTLHLNGTVQVAPTGLREVTLGPGRPRTPGRTFRYTSSAVGLTLGIPESRGARAAETPRSSAALVDDACLTTTVGPGPLLHHRFLFRLAGWSDPTLFLGLPPGAQPLAARVDGVWLDYLPTEADGVRLPVPQSVDCEPWTVDREEKDNPVFTVHGPRSTVHAYEVLYNTPAPPLWSVATLSAPLPTLDPVPLHVRRVWRLPPGMSPLSEGAWRRLPGPEAGSEDVRHTPGDLFRLIGPPAGSWSPSGPAEQRQALADAALGLRSHHGGETFSLHKLLTEMALRVPRDRRAFVIDTHALAEAGQGAETLIRLDPVTANDRETLPWEKKETGLVTWPTRAAPLLTTWQAVERWQDNVAAGRSATLDGNAGRSATLDGKAGRSATLDVDEFPVAVQDAVAEAIRSGHDASGRFRALWDWPDAGHVEASSSPSGAYTEWEPASGAQPVGVDLVVVRSAAVKMTAAGLAFLAVLLIWRSRWRTPRARLVLLALVLSATGLTLLWLPAALQPLAWWPFLAAAAAGLFWHLYLAWAMPRSAAGAETSRQVALTPGKTATNNPLPPLALFLGVLAAVREILATLTIPIVALLLGFALIDAGRGDVSPTAPPTVFVVPAADGTGETVFAPPELLDQLRARAAADMPLAAAVVAADCDGKVVGNVAQINAVFRAYSTTPGAATVVLPLEGIALEGEVKVDGVRVFPVASPAPQAGLAVPTRGPGWHEIRLAFKVPVRPGPSGDDQVLQFGSPRLTVNRLRLRLPAQAADIQAVGRQGGQRVLAANDGPTLEADLGRLSGPVSVRWSAGPRSPRPALVQFREAWLWDLRPEAATLTGYLQFQIGQGTTTRLEVELPASLVVRSATAPRLREWRVVDEGRDHLLRLDFTGPLAGEVGVSLELIPRHPLPARLTLPLPTPRGQPLKDGGYLAYRTAGRVEAQRQLTLNLTGLGRTEAFAPFWPKASQPALATLDYACVFSSGDGKRPVLPLHLRPLAPVVTAQQEITVTVRRQQADLKATLDLATADGNLAVVVWDIRPAQTRWYQPYRTLTVAGVTGRDVRFWTQEGDHLVVWLKHGEPATRIELTGWLSLTPTAAGARFDLPRLSVPGARTTTAVRLIPQGGLTLEPIALHQLTPLSATPEGRGPFLMGIDLSRPKTPARTGVDSFGVAGADYSGAWLARPTTSQPTVQIATLLDVRDKQLTFTTTIDIRLLRHEARTLTVRLREWDRQTVTLQAPKEIRWRELHPVRGERSWELDLTEGAERRDAGPTDEVRRLTLTGSMPLEEASEGIATPDVSVVEASRAEHCLVMLGPELAVEAPIPGWGEIAPARLPAWLGDARRLLRPGATAWVQRAAPTGKLRLALRERPAGAPDRLLLTDHRVDHSAERGWLYETTFWLWHEPGAELPVTWPADATLVALEVDGVPQPPGQAEAGTLWLPLPDKPERAQGPSLVALGGQCRPVDATAPGGS